MVVSTAFTEEMKEGIALGRCAPIQGYACRPFLPLEEIRAETLKPEHLDELRALANGCLEAVYHVRLHATRLVGNDDDRWWIQSSLLGAMTTALRAGYFLRAGLEDEILRAYPSSPAISGAGMTRANAHRLSTAIALDVACRAWSEIYRAEGMKPTSAAMAYTYRVPLVRMRLSDEGGFPVFKRKHIAAVVDAILGFPDFDAEEIRGRIQWENAKVKEYRAKAGASAFPTHAHDSLMPATKVAQLFGFKYPQFRRFLDSHSEIRWEQPLTKSGTPDPHRRLVSLLEVAKAVSDDQRISNDRVRMSRIQKALQRAEFDKKLENAALKLLGVA